MKTMTVKTVLAVLTALGATAVQAASPSFASTSVPAAWQVSVNVSGVDTWSDDTRFLIAPGAFLPAVQTPGRGAGDFIANNASGTNGWVGRFTQFVFRQTFDLSGFDPATAQLRFEWAADDIPTFGYWDRGNWQPQYRLNGGSYLGAGQAWYDYAGSTPQLLASGFLPGLNTLDFYVQGNGVTDGFALRVLSFTAEPVPEPQSYALLLAGLAALGTAVKRRSH